MNCCRQRGGATLIEMLTYLAVLAVVSAGAYRALHETFTHSRNLQRNADDIVAAVRAGERWRTDIRLATGLLVMQEDRLTIPQQTGSVEYRFDGGAVWRSVAGKETAVLRSVKASRMQAETRQHVTAWQWEVELVPGSKAARMSPLFSFAAVAGKGKS
jgi:Tfp pilus assembly protein PilE